MFFFCVLGVHVVTVFTQCTGLLAGEVEIEETIMTVGDQRLALVKYRGEYFTKVPLSALEKPQWKNKPVCVEGKFDGIVGQTGTAQILRLWGSEINFLYPPELGMPGLIRGDNVWIGGVADSEPGKEALRLRVRGVVKLPNDMELFRQRFATYAQKGEWRELINLGDWIGGAGKLAPSMTDQDLYRRKQRDAYRKALEVHAAQLAADDAEGQYFVAVKYRELLDDSIMTQRHLLKCLEIDPTHLKARELVQTYDYVNYEGRWMTRREMERLKEKRAPGTQQVPTDEAPGDQPVPSVEPADTAKKAPERLDAAALAVQQNRIRSEALSGGRSEVDVFIEAAGKITDPALAVHLVRLLALRPEEKVLDGIALLRSLGNEVVTKSCYEVLVWRPEKRALDDLVIGLFKETDTNVLRHGLELLSQTEPKRSYPALIGLLDAANPVTRGEAQQKLRKLTGERFEKVAEWRAWWDARKKSYE